MQACAIALLGLVALASLGCTRNQAPAAVPTPRLAYVGLDGQVYTLPLDGGDPRRVSTVAGEAPLPAGQRFARWPTWSPDGARLAFMRYELSRLAENRATIFVVADDGSSLTKVFESTDEAPIYMGWAPDGSLVTLLTQRGQGLRLQLLDPTGAAPPREVAAGSPLYYAWSPDAQRLLVHLNGDHRAADNAALQLVAPTNPAGAEELTSKPTDFRAPSWSSDGKRMAFVSQAPGGQAALAVQEAGATEPNRVAIVGSEPALLWSPTADRLAFSSRVNDQLPLYSGLETIKADGSERQRVADGGVAAFYWSPDGKRLAYAGLDRTERALSWFVADPDGKNRRQLASFVPSEEQFAMFRFFDQYAQSHGLWSPDGKYLVWTGHAPDAARPKAPPGPSGDGQEPAPGPSQVFVAAVDGSTPPRTLVDGRIALWPVRASGQR